MCILYIYIIVIIYTHKYNHQDLLGCTKAPGEGGAPKTERHRGPGAVGASELSSGAFSIQPSLAFRQSCPCSSSGRK